MNEVSVIKLNKMFGRHWERVLARAATPVLAFARKGWWTVTGELPTKEAYAALLKQAFTIDLGSVVSGAQSDLESLKDELDDWYNNLPDSFQNGEKGEMLQSAVDQLDSAIGYLNDVPESLKEIEVYVEPGSGTSRADRGSQAAYELRQAADALAEAMEKEQDEEKKQEMEDFKDELDSAADEADAVEYPGMY